MEAAGCHPRGGDGGIRTCAPESPTRFRGELRGILLSKTDDVLAGRPVIVIEAAA